LNEIGEGGLEAGEQGAVLVGVEADLARVPDGISEQPIVGVDCVLEVDLSTCLG
jgi:hypothetical protein